MQALEDEGGKEEVHVGATDKDKLSAVVRKNLTVKKRNPRTACVQFLCPLIFMALLALTRLISPVSKSPNVAYQCGQLPPFQYAESADDVEAVNSLFNCSIEPPTCTEDKYYRGSTDDVPGLGEAHEKLGYVESWTEGGNWVFYSWAAGDESTIFPDNGTNPDAEFINPSLPISIILDSIGANNALFAVAPQNTEHAEVQDAVKRFAAALRNATTSRGAAAVTIFKDNHSLKKYIQDNDYDKTHSDGSKDTQKVAMGVTFSKYDLDDLDFSYQIRVNYTGDGTTRDNDQVACLYGSNHGYGTDDADDDDERDCEEMISIPTTVGSFNTYDLYKPVFLDNMWGYSFSGFITLQEFTDSFILTEALGQPVTLENSISLMSTVKFNANSFQLALGDFLPLVLMLIYLVPVSHMLKALVHDKEARIGPSMITMGLSRGLYNLTWVSTFVVEMFLTSVGIVLVGYGSVYPHSNLILVLIYYFGVSLSIIAFCFLMSAFFTRARTASILGSVFFFCIFFPFYAVGTPDTAYSTKVAASLSSPVAFALGSQTIAQSESGLVGVHWGNSGDMVNNYKFSSCILMLYADAALYALLAWYIAQVYPAQYGQLQPLWFVCLPSYWFPERYATKRSELLTDGSGGADTDDEERRQALGASLLRTSQGGQEEGRDRRGSAEQGTEVDKDDLIGVDDYPNEPVPEDLQEQERDDRCVTIQGLRKVYPSPDGSSDGKVAVKSLSFNMYEGQITVLLGHNGAGKSTTIDMLSGMQVPTDGDAFICGYSVKKDMPKIRQFLGVCPQHDVLWPELTVREHLRMFARIKGVAKAEVDDAVEHTIADVGLREKADVLASTLSGGQKRKLSVGIAFIGGSRVVILDEPTSGMDPFSRRSTWRMIQRNKKGRVILLTTHFMDEADILGDRIAIMGEGALRCVGSSLFLKREFGVGYSLVIVRDTARVKAGDDTSNIDETVIRHVSSAESVSSIGAEKTYRLPFEASPAFVGLFRELDARKSELSFTTYGISVTTLEEVFIRVGQNHDNLGDGRGSMQPSETTRFSHADEDDREERKSGNTLKTVPGIGSADSPGAREGDPELPTSTTNGERESAIKLSEVAQPSAMTEAPKFTAADVENETTTEAFIRHFRALFRKRVNNVKRDRNAFACQLVVPMIVVLLGSLLLYVQPSPVQPKLKMSGWDWNEKFSQHKRNFVPFLALSDTARDIMGQFDNEHVKAEAVDVSQQHIPDDKFHGCARGSPDLLNMSNYLMVDDGQQIDSEDGSSRYLAAVVTGNASKLQTVSIVNGTSAHGWAILPNLVSQAFLQVASGVESAKITLYNFPLPQPLKVKLQAGQIGAFTIATFAMIAACFPPASWAGNIVAEREIKAKHQQLLAGVSIPAYWISHYAFDTLLFLPASMAIYAEFLIFDVEPFNQGPAQVATILIFLLFAPAVTSFTYLFSFLFKKHTAAQVNTLLISFVCGFALSITSGILSLFDSTSSANYALRFVFYLFPGFCFADALLQLSTCDSGRDCPGLTDDGYGDSLDVYPFSTKVVGFHLIYMPIIAIFYLVATIGVEYLLTYPDLFKVFDFFAVTDPGRTAEDHNLDDDVAAEKRRVDSGGASEDVVVLHDIRKVFDTPVGPKVAVRGLTFGLPPGECFGFLGINGAGKSTTLSILSGEYPPTSGEAEIEGLDILHEQVKIRQRVAYVPQFDATLPLLTVGEHLLLYASIKGLPKPMRPAAIEHALNTFDLQRFRNVQSRALSGGNRRKLSVALSMMGDPHIIFLDEPSTGMDPVARRFMWNRISQMSSQGKCIILTTHSMEEAEALCGRIGIMVNGQLRCLGSSVHLKNRFGQGFEVQITTRFVGHEDYSQMESQLQQALPAVLEDIRATAREAAAAEQAHRPTFRPPAPTGVTSVNGDVETGSESKQPSAAAFDEAEAVHELEHGFLTRDQLLQCASLLSGDVARHNIDRALQAGSGEVHDALRTAGGHNNGDGRELYSFRLFAEFLVSETIAEALHAWICEHFKDVQLLERASAHSFRYRVSAGDMALADVFERFETQKDELAITEYAVGATSLEQIFNQFAASQENPELAGDDGAAGEDDIRQSRGGSTGAGATRQSVLSGAKRQSSIGHLGTNTSSGN